MTFELTQKVLFRHCDPAGIAFFPRCFEMVNDVVEAFFADRLDWPFEALHRDGAVPTATIETDFRAPSRHGDRLTFTLAIERLGKTSMTYAMTAEADGEPRFKIRATLVHVDANGRPTAWPEPVRARIENQLENTL